MSEKNVHDHASDATTAALAFGSLGVVYGDIGTSVLYAVKECFHQSYGVDPTPENIMGVMSLFFWSLMVIVVFKYLTFVMRADNKGEGGILALMALVLPRFNIGKQSLRSRALMYTGLIGASLLAADGTITPSISVLSAVEGVGIATPAFHSVIVPVTIGLLVALFWFQRFGTAGVARFFAPAMLCWFAALAVSGVVQIFQVPEILLAINPWHAFRLLSSHGYHSLLILGAVMLCVTGAEALYADMGHFGRRPIKLAWFFVVMPALLLNYFGQGALIISQGAKVLHNPFFALFEGWLLYPMVVLATIAAVVASQALISGSFSLAQQAIQLGFAPRLTIIHTSGETKGQIYVPEINTVLMFACIALVLMFRDSSKLAAAYGVSVLGTMITTSILLFSVAVKRWKWHRGYAFSLVLFFISVEGLFMVGNLPKIAEGGWFPLMICLLVFSVMTTWKTGRSALVKRLNENLLVVGDFIKRIQEEKPIRTKGTAVFMTGNTRSTPPALIHHYQHNQVLHGRVILLSIVTADVPMVAPKEVLEVEDVGEGFYEVVAHFGFMQSPTVAKIFKIMKIQHGIDVDPAQATYFLGRDILLTNGPEKMLRWRKTLFAFLARNAVPATAYFGIPPNRVVELGMQVKL
jgi:KUP system potassium uptake protein